MALSPYQHFQARFLNRLKEEVAAEEYSPVHAERLQFSLAVFEFELLSHTLNFTVPDVIYAEMLIHKMDRAGYEDSIFRSAVDQVILAVHFSIFGVTEEEKAREAILRGDKLIFTGDGTGDIQFKRADYEEQNEGDPSIDDESEGEQQQQQDQTFSAPIAIMNGNNPFPNLVILPPHMTSSQDAAMLDAQTNDPYYRESCSEHNHVPADSWSNCSIWQATRVDPETGEWITDVKEVVSDAQKLVDQWYAYSSRLKTLETVYHHFNDGHWPYISERDSLGDLGRALFRNALGLGNQGEVTLVVRSPINGDNVCVREKLEFWLNWYILQDDVKGA